MGNYYSQEKLQAPVPTRRRPSFDDIENNDLYERQYLENMNQEAQQQYPFNSSRLPIKTDTNENGWNHDANDTIDNWFQMCKEYRWRYQFILDENYRFAANLNTVSIIFSSILSIFSGIKLWQQYTVFENASNVVMLVSNSVIAGITTLSKKYIDDSRNEKIRNFVESMDKFIGNIHSQATVAPIYRMDSFTFIQQYTPEYTKLMTSCPNLSIKELTLAKEKYKVYLEKVKAK